MFIIWLFSLSIIISFLVISLIDNPGFVLIDWLNYQVKIEIQIAIALAILLTLAILCFSYLFIKIVSFRFPNLAKIFFKRIYNRNIESLLLRSKKSWSVLAELLVAIDVLDDKKSQDLHIAFAKLVKNPDINNLINGKMALNQQNYHVAEKYFNKIRHFPNLDNLLYYTKFKISEQEKDYHKAMLYGEHIINFKTYDLSVAKQLFSIYRKLGRWQEAKKLISKVGAENFTDELQKRDLVIMHCGYALELYRSKNFYRAIYRAKQALKIDEDFLPAREISIKSLLHLSLEKLALRQIKKLWQDKPNMILLGLFEMAIYKLKPNKRIEAMKKIIDNSKIDKHYNYFNDIAIAHIALKAGNIDLAKSYANNANKKNLNYYSFDILAKIAKLQNNQELYDDNKKKSLGFSVDLSYNCDRCEKKSTSWAVNCTNCDGNETISWN